MAQPPWSPDLSATQSVPDVQDIAVATPSGIGAADQVSPPSIDDTTVE
jgi:hypothetical protein